MWSYISSFFQQPVDPFQFRRLPPEIQCPIVQKMTSAPQIINFIEADPSFRELVDDCVEEIYDDEEHIPIPADLLISTKRLRVCEAPILVRTYIEMIWLLRSRLKVLHLIITEDSNVIEGNTDLDFMKFAREFIRQLMDFRSPDEVREMQFSLTRERYLRDLQSNIIINVYEGLRYLKGSMMVSAFQMKQTVRTEFYWILHEMLSALTGLHVYKDVLLSKIPPPQNEIQEAQRYLYNISELKSLREIGIYGVSRDEHLYLTLLASNPSLTKIYLLPPFFKVNYWFLRRIKANDDKNTALASIFSVNHYVRQNAPPVPKPVEIELPLLPEAIAGIFILFPYVQSLGVYEGSGDNRKSYVLSLLKDHPQLKVVVFTVSPEQWNELSTAYGDRLKIQAL